MSLLAITREVSPALNQCELSWQERQPIDVAKANAQHRAYQDCLRDLGLEVLTLPAEPDLPDSVFVEDPVIALDECAIILNMGASSRRPEASSLSPGARARLWVSQKRSRSRLRGRLFPFHRPVPGARDARVGCR